MRGVTDDGKGQAELQLYELATITAVRAEQERGAEKAHFMACNTLRDTHKHTHTHTHINYLWLSAIRDT